MASPVICIRDASVTNGQLMVKDLWPNRSQANPVVDPAPQGPRYLRVVEDTLPVVANNLVSRQVSGLSAYLLVTLDAGAAGAQLTPAQASAMATSVIATMRTGVALDLATLNGLFAAVVAGTGIGLGASTATVVNVLRILGGARFVVPVGTNVNVNFLTANVQEGLFDTTVHAEIIPEDSSFWISLAKGNLLKMKSSRIDPRTNATLNPYVVVYDTDGSVL
jgi:hypothetical protein